MKEKKRYKEKVRKKENLIQSRPIAHINSDIYLTLEFW
jgi:hypothetical protein